MPSFLTTPINFQQTTFKCFLQVIGVISQLIGLALFIYSLKSDGLNQAASLDLFYLGVLIGPNKISASLCWVVQAFTYGFIINAGVFNLFVFSLFLPPAGLIVFLILLIFVVSSFLFCLLVTIYSFNWPLRRPLRYWQVIVCFLCFAPLLLWILPAVHSIPR